MDQTQLQKNKNKEEFITEKTSYGIEEQRLFNNEDSEFKISRKQKTKLKDPFIETGSNVKIERAAQTKTHHFAKKKAVKGKKSVKEKEQLIIDDPFAMLANCSRTTASKEMTRVKDALTKIDGLMDQEVSVTEKDFKLEQTKIVAAYNEVITHCDSYLQARKGTRWTDNGKLRKLMVQEIKERCSEELKHFEAASESVFAEVQGGENKQWIDVLQKIRTETIDMDRKDRKVTMGGAGTSEVLICRIENENKYFKQTEKFENIPSLDLAYREMEVAAKGSMEERIKNYLDQNPKKNKNFKKFFNMMNFMPIEWFPSEVDNESFIHTRKNFSDVFDDGGVFFETICPDVESTKRFIAFAIKLWKNNVKLAACEVAQIEDGEVLSNRNVATSRLANLLGVPKLIASSKNVNLMYEGKAISGNIMDEAKGEPYGQILREAKASKLKLKMSSEALKQVYTLQFLDYLCGQIDRNMGNFLCTTEKNKDSWIVTGITGIDNDISFGELDLKKLKGKRKVQELPPIFDEKGVFCIPAMDEEFSRRLMSITPEELKFTLKDLLGENALNAACKRLEGLKKIVLDAVEKGDTKLISDKDSQNLWEEAHEKRPSNYTKS